MILFFQVQSEHSRRTTHKGASQIGALGNDTLIGGNGSDTFVFRMGDGQDVIQDQGYSSTDVLRIEGYDLADIVLSRAAGDTNDAVITFAGSTDSLRLVDALDNSSGYFDSNDRIERTQIGANAQQSLMDFYA